MSIEHPTAKAGVVWRLAMAPSSAEKLRPHRGTSVSPPDANQQPHPSPLSVNLDPLPLIRDRHRDTGTSFSVDAGIVFEAEGYGPLRCSNAGSPPSPMSASGLR
jgi:hypothetical protein